MINMVLDLEFDENDVKYCLEIYERIEDECYKMCKCIDCDCYINCIIKREEQIPSICHRLKQEGLI